MTKKVAFGTQPAAKSKPASADNWVQTRSTDSESMKRLTIDIPADLHRRLKLIAASKSVNMVDLLREWIEAGVEELN
jgi:hypothetical protein